MDAIVIAGGIPQPGDALYEFTLGQPKALLELCGKPMVQWVLDALNESQSVGSIVIIGLTEDHPLNSPKIKAYIPTRGGMLDNIKAGAAKIVELNPDSEHALVVSADIPGVTAEAVDWVITEASKTDDDIYYNVITRAVMEARYPASKRSYAKLKDVEVCGGDMNVARCSKVTENSPFWEGLINARKNVLKQAALIGFDTLFLLLIRQVTMQGAVTRVARRAKMTGRALLCPYAEVGMDVDKPHQLELMRADLAQRAACPD
jgi:GTP:adenosylcobinamide-phosphate guanylyltransferase